MSSENEITVAIPVYNGQKYILEALQSITNQTKKVNEILVCDNQSTDNTIEIVKKFFTQNPDIRTRLHENETNLGYQKNFNKCMELCETDFLLLLAADDRLKKDTIKVAWDFLIKNKDYALAGGYADSIDQEGNTTEKYSKKPNQFFKKGEILEFLKLNRLYLIPSSILLRMNLIRNIGYWDLNLGPDERFWPRVIKEYPIAILGDCVVDRRVHSDQTAIIDYATKFNRVIISLKENLKVAYYESSSSRVKETKTLIRQQNSSSSLMMGNLVIKYYHKYWIGFKYLMFSIQQAPSLGLKYKRFLKTLKIFISTFLIVAKGLINRK